MLTIAICDDQKIFVEEIERILKLRDISFGETDETIVIDKFLSGVELFSKLENGYYYDLMFLDIDMPLLTGLQLSQKIRNELNNKSTQIVFVSGRAQYEKALFDVEPLRFIKKGGTADGVIPKDKIYASVDEVIAIKYPKKEYFTYEKEGEDCQIWIDEILYFEDQKRSIIIHTKYGEVLINKAFKELEKEIQHDSKMKDFIKCNRKMIVNRKYCNNLSGSDLYLADGKLISVGIMSKNKVKAFLSEKDK